MRLSGRNITFSVASKSFFDIDCTANIVLAIIEFKDVNVAPHGIKIQKWFKTQRRTSSAEARLMNLVTTISSVPTDELPAYAEKASAGRRRRERDSNPRTFYSQRFSRPPHSTALPSLRAQN